jgi:alkylation response protein AidB-like acyl-CoA dehydrogenase
MNLNYTEEQVLLRDSISKFCGSDYDFETRMKAVNSESGQDKELWKMFAELGWLAVPFAEEFGGFGGDEVDLSVVFEEFGKAIVVEPYLANIVLGGGVLRRADFADSASYIEKLVSGEVQYL